MATTETQAPSIAEQLGEATVGILGRFEDGIRKGGETLRKLHVSERSARVTLGRWMGKAYDAGMALAPTGKDARKTYETALQQQLVEWVGIAPRTGELYPWQTLRQMIVSAQVIDALPQDVRGAIGVDTAQALAAIPEDGRETFVRARLDKGESMAPRAVRPAVNEYLIASGDRTAPTLQGRMRKLTDKHRGTDETTAAVAAVKILVPRMTPEKSDALSTVIGYVLAVAGQDVKSDVHKINREACAQLLTGKVEAAS